MNTKFGTAICKGQDSFIVGQQAAKQAMENANCKTVDFSIVFTSGDYDCKSVLEGIKSVVGDTPVIGCTTAGVFNEKKVEIGSVACGVISSQTHKFYTGHGCGLRKDETICFREAANKLPCKTENFPYTSLIMLADGLAGKGEEVSLNPLTELGTNIKVSGGTAGDDYKFKSTKVFNGNVVSEDAVSLALVNSKTPVSIGVKHGHYPISHMFRVTKANGNKVYELDGKPATEVWLECIKEVAKKFGIDTEKMYDIQEQLVKCTAIFSPGLFTGDGYKIRWIVPPINKDYLTFTCTIPEGCVVRIMESSKQDQICSAGEAALAALKSTGGVKLAGAMVFDCAVRGVLLGDDFYKAVEEIKKVIGDIPLIGFETYGEFALELGQLSGFHNTTTVVLLFPD
ncbi:MAG: FIST N-terminal domain-containing protein [Elusimicrobiota bacterium]